MVELASGNLNYPPLQTKARRCSLRLPCPVGHYGLLSILGGSAWPPSLLTLPPVVGRRGILQHLYRVVTDTGLRALRDLRAPLARYAFLGFLRHPPTHPCRKQALYIAGQSEPPVLPLLCLTDVFYVYFFFFSQQQRRTLSISSDACIAALAGLRASAGLAPAPMARAYFADHLGEMPFLPSYPHHAWGD